LRTRPFDVKSKFRSPGTLARVLPIDALSPGVFAMLDPRLLAGNLSGCGFRAGPDAPGVLIGGWPRHPAWSRFSNLQQTRRCQTLSA